MARIRYNPEHSNIEVLQELAERSGAYALEFPAMEQD
jgi:hypothetical protein